MTAQSTEERRPIIDAELRQAIESYFPLYPERQGALLPALHLVQERLGFVPHEAILELAELFGIHPAEVADVVSFYSFFKQDRPLGKFRIWVCRSISCAAGAENICLSF